MTNLLTDLERAFLSRRRVGRLATADPAAVPHVIPVCFALGGDVLYTAIDQKPKRGTQLKRLQNIACNPAVTFLADHYEENWSKLGWVMVEGRGEILTNGAEFSSAECLLRERYPQYAGMRLSPIVAIRIVRVRSWGNLEH